MSVRLEVNSDGVAVIEMDHGRVNALDIELCNQITATFAAAREQARAIVLTGNDRAFCAGVDLARMLEGDTSYAHEFLAALSRCFLAVYRVDIPTVAAVNGHAIAGGCVIACACDRTLLTDEPGTLVGLTELAVGVPFPTAAVEIVRGRISTRSREAILLARNYPPDGALRIEFADELVTPDDLLPRALAEAQQLAQIPPSTYQLAKEQIQRPVNDAINAMSDAWDAHVAAGWSSAPVREAIGAFMDQLRKDR